MERKINMKKEGKKGKKRIRREQDKEVKKKMGRERKC